MRDDFPDWRPRMARASKNSRGLYRENVPFSEYLRQRVRSAVESGSPYITFRSAICAGEIASPQRYFANTSIVLTFGVFSATLDAETASFELRTVISRQLSAGRYPRAYAASAWPVSLAP